MEHDYITSANGYRVDRSANGYKNFKSANVTDWLDFITFQPVPGRGQALLIFYETI